MAMQCHAFSIFLMFMEWPSSKSAINVPSKATGEPFSFTTLHTRKMVKYNEIIHTNMNTHTFVHAYIHTDTRRLELCLMCL